MVAPLLIAGGALAAGGLAGQVATMFGKKKKIDTSRQQALIAEGSDEQKRAIGQMRPESQKLEQTFGQSVDTAQEGATEESRQAAQDFLANYDPLVSSLVQKRKDALKQSTFEALPETVQAAREAGAAGGGLQRGAIQSQLANIPVQAAAEYARGASQLEDTAMTQQLSAREKVYDQGNQMILKNLGIDTATAEAILNSGNSALINELNGLIDESRNRIGSLVGIENFRQSGQMAQDQASAAQKMGLFQSMTGLGASMMGGAGGAAGGAASSLATQVNPQREAVMQALNQRNAQESMNIRRSSPYRG